MLYFWLGSGTLRVILGTSRTTSLFFLWNVMLYHFECERQTLLKWAWFVTTWICSHNFITNNCSWKWIHFGTFKVRPAGRRLLMMLWVQISRRALETPPSSPTPLAVTFPLRVQMKEREAPHLIKSAILRSPLSSFQPKLQTGSVIKKSSRSRREDTARRELRPYIQTIQFPCNELRFTNLAMWSWQEI